MSEKNKPSQRNGDHIYFAQIPRIVWALSRSPYDYMLWSVIKDIAGENFECKITTKSIAALSMMSVRKVVDCRKYLIESGLLEGTLEKDEKNQPVWNLVIPDLWENNVRLAKSLLKIRERVKYKIEQLDAFKKHDDFTPAPHAGGSCTTCSTTLHHMQEGHAPHAAPLHYIREDVKEEPKEEPTSKAHFLESKAQQQENPNAYTLPTETRSDCAAPPTGGLRADSERPEPSVAVTGVGEDRPSWVRYVAAYYNTRDEHSILKHLKAADKVSELTGEKVAAWCARCGTLQEWLRSNVDGTFAGKTNGRAYSNGHSNGNANGNGKSNGHYAPAFVDKPKPQSPHADRTREFFFEKLVPLDIKCHGKQTLFYNPQEHPKVFAMAWQCEWPEEEILKRLPRYWRSTNDFYRKAGYNLRLFFQNFDEFADQLSKVEMRYPLLKDVYAEQERQQARNGA